MGACAFGGRQRGASLLHPGRILAASGTGPGDNPGMSAEPPTASACWYLYLLECRDGSLYTGIAIDVAMRYALHAAGRGARYTRSHPPLRVLASFEHPDRSSAAKAEYAIKRLTPAQKRALAGCSRGR